MADAYFPAARTHELKADYHVFEAVIQGIKPWEIRLNDRQFKAGDYIYLRETRHSGEAMQAGLPLVYTGRSIRGKIHYVLQGQYGLQKDWCVLSVAWDQKGATP